jgi:drug/metabolite transporter (DMT)-like permease
MEPPAEVGGPHGLKSRSAATDIALMSTRRAPETEPEGGPGSLLTPMLEAVSEPDVAAGSLKHRVEKRGRLIGSAIAAFTALMFASGTVLLASLLSPTGNPYVILAARFGGVVVLLAIFVVATGRPIWPEPGERLSIAIAGIVGYGTEAAFFSGALNHGHAATVELLFYTYPVLVMFGTIAVEKKAPPRLLIGALVCSVAGGSIVVLNGSGVAIQPIGVVFILACAVGYSGYLIGLDRYVKRTDMMTSVLWLAAGAGLANATFALVFGNNQIPHGAQWFKVAGMAIITAAAFVALLATLRRIGALRSSIIGVIEPLGVAILGAFFLSQPITGSTAIGGTLILAGAIAAALVKSRRVAEAA